MGHHLDVHGVGVGVAENRDAFDAQHPSCSDDATCDFAAIGDENFVDHLSCDVKCGDRISNDRGTE